MKLDELIERDGRTCLWCGRELWPRDLTAEHILPRARRGRGDPANLAIACRTCNRRRGTRSVAAHVRAEQRAGARPRLDLIVAALCRLGASALPEHAHYAQRQLALLGRIEPSHGTAGRITAGPMDPPPRPARP